MAPDSIKKRGPEQHQPRPFTEKRNVKNVSGKIYLLSLQRRVRLPLPLQRATDR